MKTLPLDDGHSKEQATKGEERTWDAAHLSKNSAPATSAKIYNGARCVEVGISSAAASRSQSVDFPSEHQSE